MSEIEFESVHIGGVLCPVVYLVEGSKSSEDFETILQEVYKDHEKAQERARALRVKNMTGCLLYGAVRVVTSELIINKDQWENFFG